MGEQQRHHAALPGPSMGGFNHSCISILSSFPGKGWVRWAQANPIFQAIFNFCCWRIHFICRNILFSVPLHNFILTKVVYSWINSEECSGFLFSKKSFGTPAFIYWFILFPVLFLPCLVWLSDQFNKKWKTCADCVIKQSRLLKALYYAFNILYKIQIWNRDMLNKMGCWYFISVHIIAMNRNSHQYISSEPSKGNTLLGTALSLSVNTKPSFGSGLLQPQEMRAKDLWGGMCYLQHM